MDEPGDFLPRVLETLALKASGRSSERRGAPRFGLHGSAQMIPMDDNCFPRSCLVRVRDVSAKGIGVIASEKLPAGSKFALHFDDGTRPDCRLRVTCQAEHCQRVGESAHRIGAKVVQVESAIAA